MICGASTRSEKRKLLEDDKPSSLMSESMFMSSAMAFREATGAAEAAVAESRSVDAASSSTTARRIEHRRGQRLHESRPEVCNRGSTTLCE